MQKSNFQWSPVQIQAGRAVSTAVATLGLLTACGSSKSDSEAPPVVVYGNLTVAASTTETDNGTYALTSADACSRDINTGIVKVSLSQGAGKASMAFTIKDFSATPKTYTCKQAADNQSGDGVGSLFETCMVEAKVPSSAGATTLNGYSMYRETVATEKFTYAGTCTIDVTTAPPNAKGTFACTSLVQIVRNGTPRNPVSDTITATATGDFNCNFR